jgi:hypothetical protein
VKDEEEEIKPELKEEINDAFSYQPEDFLFDTGTDE